MSSPLAPIIENGVSPTEAIAEHDSVVRRKTRTVMVKDLPVGSGHPIYVQSMTKTKTADWQATVERRFCRTRKSYKTERNENVAL